MQCPGQDAISIMPGLFYSRNMNSTNFKTPQAPPGMRAHTESAMCVHMGCGSWLCWRLRVLETGELGQEAPATCLIWSDLEGKNHPEVTETIMGVCLELTKNAFDWHKAIKAAPFRAGTRQ